MRRTAPTDWPAYSAIASIAPRVCTVGAMTEKRCTGIVRRPNRPRR
jgi:hypothetical protein